MKKLLLIYLSIFCTTAMSFGQQLPNSNFETWNSILVLNPSGYFSSNLEYGYNDPSTLRSNDAYSGNYALRLQTKYIGDMEFNFGFIVNFDPDQFAGGLPFSFHATTVNGYYKAGIQEQDTALVLVMLMKDGNQVGGGILKIAASDNTEDWTAFSYPTYLEPGVDPDSVMIGITSSNAISEVGIAEGSWLMIDSLYFKDDNGNIELADNFDFENWDEFEAEFLEAFYTSQLWASVLAPPVVEKYSPGSNGDYAVKLNTISPDYDTFNFGIISNGDISQNNFPIPGTPFTGKPDAMTFDYQNFRDPDSEPAEFFIEFYKNSEPVASGYKNFTDNTSDYVTDTLFFEFTDTPDSVLFIASNGETEGSWFIIDNLQMEYFVGTNDRVEIFETVAFPNPATDKLNFSIVSRTEAVISVSVIDLSGKIVLTEQFNLSSGENIRTIDVSSLSKGSYLYSIQVGNDVFTRKFIKN